MYDSSRMALALFSVAATTIGAIALGNSSRAMMCQFVAPMARAARVHSRSCSDRTWLREELAAAKRRIRELETELAIDPRAAELLKEQAEPQGGSARSR